MNKIVYDSKLAEKYNSFHGRSSALNKLQIQKLAYYLDGFHYPKILDVGCGAGRLIGPLALEIKNKVYGVEYSEEMYKKCTTSGYRNNIQAWNMSYQQFLENPPMTFDSAYFSYSLHQIEYDTNKQIDILHKTFDELKVKKILLITGSDELFDLSLLNLCSPKLDAIDRERFLSIKDIRQHFNIEIYENEMNYKVINYDVLCNMIDSKFISTIQLLNEDEIKQLKENLLDYADSNNNVNWTDYYSYILISRK